MPPGPNTDEMLKAAQVSWVISAGGHALWVCSTLTFHFDFSYSDDIWIFGKKAVCPQSDSISVGAKYHSFFQRSSWQLIPAEVLTMCVVQNVCSFPPNTDNQLGQDLAMKCWWPSHHGLLKDPKVDKFPLAQAALVQPVLEQELCPRALLAHFMFSDSFKNTPISNWCLIFWEWACNFPFSSLWSPADKIPHGVPRVGWCL